MFPLCDDPKTRKSFLFWLITTISVSFPYCVFVCVCVRDKADLSPSFSLYLCCLSRIQQEVPSKAVLEQEMVWMKEHLSTLGSPVVLCHNDLLCKNIIHNSKEGT